MTSDKPNDPSQRAAQLQSIFDDVTPQLVRFVGDADEERDSHRDSDSDTTQFSCLVKFPAESRLDLENKLENVLNIDREGFGEGALSNVIEKVLSNSVNTSAPGFLDKLYAAPLPPGIVAESILGVLNTNLHVYQVSPVLTLIEKRVTKLLANIFGLSGVTSGGISVQGGSASNMTSIVIARNMLFPETKAEGNNAVKGKLLLFTSAHGHYSIEKAAQALGLGSSNVISVPVDDYGQMRTDELSRLIKEAKEQGNVPFYINATAGSTVLGSFDPFTEIARIAESHRMWFHIDAAWGGGFAFSGREDLRTRLDGSELADSIATNPHKMLGVPMTCSFLLGKDMRQFQSANTLKAGYLFHDEAVDDETSESINTANGTGNGYSNFVDDKLWEEPYDLADLTLQCGRRGDSFKLFLCLKYYGLKGFARMVDGAYEVACHLSSLVIDNSDLTSVLQSTPGCLQVCFYFTPCGKFVHGLADSATTTQNTKGGPHQADASSLTEKKTKIGNLNSRVTARIAKMLIRRGFMVDYAPALEGQEDKGSFFRVVVNISTIHQTVEKLVKELVDVGRSLDVGEPNGNAGST